MIQRLFLSVGAMKAGTTWLRLQLAEHPEIFFTPEKEIHYFSDPKGELGPMTMASRVDRFKRVMSNLNSERINKRVRGNIAWYGRKYLANSINSKWYTRLFDGIEESQFAADFSNLYCLLDTDQWQLVRDTCNELRVVYTMRHPIKRLWSHLKFQQEFSGNSFDEFDASESRWKEMIAKSDIAPYGDYERALKNLRSHLNQDELLVMFFEDFRTSPEACLRQIEQFLGIREMERSEAKMASVVNSTTPSPIPKNLATAASDYHNYQVNAVAALRYKVPESWLSY